MCVARGGRIAHAHPVDTSEGAGGPHQGSADNRYHVNLSLQGNLLDAARAARINLSALLERALNEELVRLRWLEWRERNAVSIAAYNEHVRENRKFAEICLRI